MGSIDAAVPAGSKKDEAAVRTEGSPIGIQAVAWALVIGLMEARA
jgi:hypothetical protein